MSEPPQQEPPPPRRLDPERAAAAAAPVRDRPKPPQPQPVIDVRPYRWMIGIFGLILLLTLSIYEFAKNGVGNPGVQPGKRLHFFVAPLATSHVNLDANTKPRCDPGHPNRDGLNVCGQAPIVLAFFAIGSGACVREVDTLQALSSRYAAVQFAAVAVHAERAETAALVRSHRWTIPVAYDRDGAVGALYGVEICPIVELAYRGGTVARRLIGEKWVNPDALAPGVALLAARR